MALENVGKKTIVVGKEVFPFDDLFKINILNCAEIVGTYGKQGECRSCLLW